MHGLLFAIIIAVTRSSYVWMDVYTNGFLFYERKEREKKLN